jgi:hypothetical protein
MRFSKPILKQLISVILLFHSHSPVLLILKSYLAHACCLLSLSINILNVPVVCLILVIFFFRSSWNYKEGYQNSTFFNLEGQQTSKLYKHPICLLNRVNPIKEFVCRSWYWPTNVTWPPFMPSCQKSPLTSLSKNFWSSVKNCIKGLIIFGFFNGKESTVNRALGGSTYPG